MRQSVNHVVSDFNVRADDSGLIWMRKGFFTSAPRSGWEMPSCSIDIMAHLYFKWSLWLILHFFLSLSCRLPLSSLSTVDESSPQKKVRVKTICYIAQKLNETTSVHFDWTFCGLKRTYHQKSSWYWWLNHGNAKICPSAFIYRCETLIDVRKYQLIVKIWPHKITAFTLDFEITGFFSDLDVEWHKPCACGISWQDANKANEMQSEFWVVGKNLSARFP